MRDTLPLTKPHKIECGVINTDLIKNSGTHWVAYIKNGNCVSYFDSYGNLKPILELVRYLGNNVKIKYNFENYQNYNQIICGHLCIEFLYRNKNVLK